MGRIKGGGGWEGVWVWVRWVEEGGEGVGWAGGGEDVGGVSAWRVGMFEGRRSLGLVTIIHPLLLQLWGATTSPTAVVNAINFCLPHFNFIDSVSWSKR